MKRIKGVSIHSEVARLGLSVNMVAPYIEGVADVILRTPAFDTVDGLLCEGRRLVYALFSTGTPLRQYYKWPVCQLDVSEEEVCTTEVGADGLIQIQWCPFAKFFPNC